MKRSYFVSLLLLLFLAFGFKAALAASNLEEGVNELASQISKNMSAFQKKKIAIVEFVDLKGDVTAFGQFLAEELITKTFTVGAGRFEVVERSLLNKVVSEQKLSLTGVIDPDSARQVGKILGVDAIVTGSVTDLGNSVKVNARMIDTETAKVFAAASTDIPKVDMVTKLMQQKVSSAPAEQKTKAEIEQGEQTVKGGVITLVLKRCKLSGKIMTCYFNVTNDSDNVVYFFFGHKDNLEKSRLYDDMGDEHKGSQAVLITRSGKSSTELSLVPRVTIEGEFKFDDVSPQVSKAVIIYLRTFTDREVIFNFREFPITK